MSVHLSVKNVPDEIAEQLRRRAERSHRSLQGELLAILEQAASAPLQEPESAAAPDARDGDAAVSNDSTRRRITIADLAASARTSGLMMPSESASILRKLRDERNSR
jgi:plasmid stability protein